MTDAHRDLRQSAGSRLTYGGTDLELRAADADRDRAAAVLGGSLATGRLTSAEHAVYGRENEGDADGPVIRIVGDARFSKVAVYRGRLDRHEGWTQWQQH
jgi:hypothetical protein